MTYFMTQKGHLGIRGRRDPAHDAKGHSGLFCRFNLVFDPKMSQGH